MADKRTADRRTADRRGNTVLAGCVLALALVACAAEAPVALPASASLGARALPAGARVLVALAGADLVLLGARSDVPVGGDGPTLLSLGLSRGAQLTPLALPSPAIGALAWGDAAAVLSADGTLRRLGGDGARSLVARAVVDVPAVSDDGRLLAYVTHDGALAYAVRLIDAQGTRTLAHDVPSAGALRFSPDARTLVLVGRSAGGVAGLHALDASQENAPRCLTNCDLVTGQPWGARFVPLPAGAAALRFDADDVLYDSVRVAYRGGAR